MWEKKKISDAYFYQEGPGVRKTQFTTEGIKLLNVGNINNGTINLETTSIYISEQEAFGRYKHFLVNSGDLLIACSGIVVDNFHNKIAFVTDEDLPLCLNTSTMRFSSLDNSKYSLRYLRYFLQTNNFKSQLSKLITGSAQLNFGPSHIRQLFLPTPPLPIQEKIAAILDKADELRRKDQELQDKYDKLAKAIFIDMFGDPVRNEKGWEVKKLGELGTLKNGLNYNRNEIGITLKILGVGDFKNKWIIDNIQGLSSICVKILPSEEYLVQNNDLIFVRSNGNRELVGRCVLTKNIIEPTTFSGFCIRFRNEYNKLDNIFLIKVLTNDTFKKYILGGGRGANIQNINQSILSSLLIPIPPLHLQEVFAKKIELINELKAKANKEKSEELFQSLLQRAFKGELTSTSQLTE